MAMCWYMIYVSLSLCKLNGVIEFFDLFAKHSGHMVQVDVGELSLFIDTSNMSQL